MPVDLVWSPTALAHLRAIYDYIVADNPVAALEVQEAIEQAVGRLQENPRLGRPGRVRATRELVVAAYPAQTPP